MLFCYGKLLFIDICERKQQKIKSLVHITLFFLNKQKWTTITFIILSP